MRIYDIINMLIYSKYKIWILFILIISIAYVSFGKEKNIYAKKYYVIDGDTICVYKNKYKSIKVRLYGIDAPELSQEYGKDSRTALIKLLKKRPIKVNVVGTDKYKRKVGIVSTSAIADINLKMIETGNAIYYERYAKYNIEYKRAQTFAKYNNLGIWNLENFEMPEVYREKHK